LLFSTTRVLPDAVQEQLFLHDKIYVCIHVKERRSFPGYNPREAVAWRVVVLNVCHPSLLVKPFLIQISCASLPPLLPTAIDTNV
jgi:hypothetical protein